MSFTVPAASTLAGQKDEIVATAAQLVKIPGETQSAAEAARCAAVDAAAIHWRRVVKRAIESALEEALDGYCMIEGDFEDTSDVAAWHAGLTAAAASSLGGPDSAVLPSEMFAFLANCDLQEPDRIGDVADDMADVLITASLPAAKDVGKFLAVVGIVKADLDALAAQAPAADTEGRAGVGADIPPPPAVAPINMPPTNVRAVIVSDTTISASIADEQPAGSGVPAPNPDKATLGKAYQLLYEQSNCDPDVLSTALGCSRSTIMNYMTGRTSGKATPDQARILVNDIGRRESALREAKAIFAAVV